MTYREIDRLHYLLSRIEDGLCLTAAERRECDELCEQYEREERQV